MPVVTVTATDVAKTVLTVLWLPFAVTWGIIAHFTQGRKHVSLTTDILLVLVRSLSPLPLSMKRQAANRVDLDAVLNSPRLRSAKPNLCRPVQREHFAGYWVCQGSLGLHKAPSECDIVLYYAHGGAYVLGGPLMLVAQLLRIAELVESKGLSIAIFSLQYSLAPEASFPQPFDEAIAAYRYLLEEMHIKPETIVISGESAGGHLALTVLDRIARSKGTIPKPGGATLMYPWVDLSNSRDSFNRNRENDMLVKSDLDKAVRWACSKLDPTALAQVFDFSAPKPQGYWRSVLPSETWVGVGSHDLFIDSIESFVRDAREDGSDISLDIDQGKPHGYLGMMDILSRKKYLQLNPEDDVGSLMPGARLIADAVLKVSGKL